MARSISRWQWGALAGALGLAGALLFTNAQGNPLPKWGPNLLVWILLALGALAGLARQAGIGLKGDGLWLAAPLVFFAASFFLREDEFLRFWNGVFLLVSAALLVTRCRGPWRVASAGYTGYLRLCALAAAYTVAGAFSALGGKRRDAEPPRVVLPNSRLGGIGKPAPQFAAGAGLSMPPEPSSGAGFVAASAPAAATAAAALTRDGALTPAAVLKGALLSVVPLVIFGCLFASADPVFGHLWGELFDWNLSALAWRIVWGAALGLIGIGLLHTALQREPAQEQTDRDRLPDGSVAPRSLTALFQQGGDVVVALVLIDLLFAVFVAVQFSFLFGGSSVARNVPGLNYASYGRSGFFELAWVAGLALPMMLLAHWLTRTAPEVARTRVRRCTGVLTGLLFVIVASAFKRMALYEMAWGMTEKRLLVSVFIGAISVVFVWFLATVWRGRTRRFAIGLLCAAMLTIGGLDVFNTDAWVVQVDAHRSRGLTNFSALYLYDNLGTDAIPALISAMPHVAAKDQPQLAQLIVHADGGAGMRDWRVWNASDAVARRAVAAHRADLNPLAKQCLANPNGCWNDATVDADDD